MTTPVVIMGLGEIGREVARAVLSIPELSLVGAVEVSSKLVGQPLSDVLEALAPDVTITHMADEAFRAAAGGVVIHTTGSKLERVVDEIEAAVRAGLSVVSSCEELAWPWVRHPHLAERLDTLALKQGVSLLGTGVNPGFVLDRLVAMLGQATGRVERVEAVRVVDAALRREGLQRKTGAGLTEAVFHKAVAEGVVGHVGLMESAALAAMGVGHSVDEVDEDIQPVFAMARQRALFGVVRPGEICGVRQVARAFSDGREVARLDLTLALGAANPHDEIRIFGAQPLTMTIPGGVPGDSATAWLLANAALQLGRGAEPGLLTSLDLPVGR